MKIFFKSKKEKVSKEIKMKNEFEARDRQTDYITKFISDELEASEQYLKSSLDRNIAWTPLPGENNSNLANIDETPRDVMIRNEDDVSDKTNGKKKSNITSSTNDSNIANSLNYISPSKSFVPSTVPNPASKFISSEWLAEIKIIGINSIKSLEPSSIKFPAMFKTITRKSTLDKLITAFRFQQSLSPSELVEQIMILRRENQPRSIVGSLNPKESMELEQLSDAIRREEVQSARQQILSVEAQRMSDRIALRESSQKNKLNLTGAGSIVGPETGHRKSVIPSFFSPLGLHVGTFESFIYECGGKLSLQKLNVAQVYEKYIKNRVAGLGYSYCDMLQQRVTTGKTKFGLPVSLAQVVVCYSPSLLFLDLVDLLLRRYANDLHAYIWIDIFSTDLHSVGLNASDQSIIAAQLASRRVAHRTISHTVVALPDFDCSKREYALNDPWIIHDLFLSAEARNSVDILISSPAENDLCDAIASDFEEFYKDFTDFKIDDILTSTTNMNDPIEPTEVERRSFLTNHLAKLVSEGSSIFDINEKAVYQLRGGLNKLIRRILTGQLEPIDISKDLSLKMTLGKLYMMDFNPSKALPLFKESFEVRLAKLGPSDRLTLDAQCCYGNALHGERKFDLAYSVLSENLAICKVELGDNHIDTLTSRKSLALHLVARKRYDQAGPLLIEWVIGSRRTLGPDHEESLLAIFHLATLYTDLRQYAKAEPLFVECVNRHKSVYGPDHPATLRIMNSIAVFYWNQSSYKDAERIYLEILDVCRTVSDNQTIVLNSRANHRNLLKCMNNLALMYREQGRHEDARPLFLDSLHRFKKMLGDTHPDTLKAAGNLGRFYLELEQLDEAESIFVEVYEQARANLGSKDTLTLKAASNLAELHLKQGALEKAKLFLLKFIPEARRSLGDSSAEVLKAFYQLAKVFVLQGDYIEAEDLMLDCLARWRIKAGVSHPDTALVLATLSDFYISQERYSEAQSTCEDCLKALRYLLGDAHPETLRRLYDLTIIYQQRLEIDKAVTLYASFSDFDTIFSSTSAEASKIKSYVPSFDIEKLKLCLINDYGVIMNESKKYKIASVSLLNSYQKAEKLYTSDHYITLLCMCNVALHYVISLNYDIAEEWLGKCYDQRSKLLGESHFDTLNTCLYLGCLLMLGKRYTEAESYLTKSYEGMRNTLGAEHSDTNRAAYFLLELYQATNY